MWNHCTAIVNPSMASLDPARLTESSHSSRTMESAIAVDDDIETANQQRPDIETEHASLSWDTVKTIATQALALTVQEWTTLGQPDDPLVSETNMFQDVRIAVDRIACLLFIRIVAMHQNTTSMQSYYDEQEEISTSFICRNALIANEPPWDCMKHSVWTQLQQLVSRLCSAYSTELPFHNAVHAATVVISVNKLLDLALNGTHSCYGLRENPLLLVALLFAALIHDVKHQGVKNSQLTIENDTLALLYNDTSIQEKNSLHFAFYELLKPDYQDLRDSLFQKDDSQYRYFRNVVISTVMSTDLSCPEQTALTRSKWKEAFSTNNTTVRGIPRAKSNRRGSNCSEVSELTLDLQFARDSPKARPLQKPRSKSGKMSSPMRRRLSSDSNYATQRWMHRRKSNDDSIMDDGDAVDSVVLIQQQPRETPDRTNSETTKESQASSFLSVAVESIGIHQKRMDGGHSSKSKLLRAALPRDPLNINGDESSGSVTSSDEEEEYGGTIVSGMGNLDRRRDSTHTGYRKRLGIRRSIDFSGEAIEVYSRRNSLGGVSALSADQDAEESQKHEGLDLLRATAVLELLLRAADVGHFLQGWGNMTQWSSRMFLELQRAHRNRRGPDPCPDWFDNQIKVVDLYLRPLACQLDECGIFGDFVGAMFAEIVDDIKARWLMNGHDLTEELMEIDPSESSFLPTDSSCLTTEQCASIVQHGDLDDDPNEKG